MRQHDDEAPADLPAGTFSSWLSGLASALAGDGTSDVPCGDCTACCTSSQFVHIGPDEDDTLAHIPSALLFPAPGLPAGHVVLGYDENGHCPMLVGGRCSIYEHRPRTCRTYDCRVFPATGLDVEGDGKPLIARRARRWRFDITSDDDRSRQAAVRAAATYLQDHGHRLAGGVVPTNPTQLAVLALEIHEVFLRVDPDTLVTSVVSPDPDVVGEEVARRLAVWR